MPAAMATDWKAREAIFLRKGRGRSPQNHSEVSQRRRAVVEGQGLPKRMSHV